MREEIEAFLYREARLLDGERQHEWLTEMVDADISYEESTLFTDVRTYYVATPTAPYAC